MHLLKLNMEPTAQGEVGAMQEAEEAPPELELAEASEEVEAEASEAYSNPPEVELPEAAEVTS